MAFRGPKGNYINISDFSASDFCVSRRVFSSTWPSSIWILFGIFCGLAFLFLRKASETFQPLTLQKKKNTNQKKGGNMFRNFGKCWGKIIFLRKGEKMLSNITSIFFSLAFVHHHLNLKTFKLFNHQANKDNGIKFENTSVFELLSEGVILRGFQSWILIPSSSLEWKQRISFHRHRPRDPTEIQLNLLRSKHLSFWCMLAPHCGQFKKSCFWQTNKIISVEC